MCLLPSASEQRRAVKRGGKTWRENMIYAPFAEVFAVGENLREVERGAWLPPALGLRHLQNQNTVIMLGIHHPLDCGTLVMLLLNMNLLPCSCVNQTKPKYGYTSRHSPACRLDLPSLSPSCWQQQRTRHPPPSARTRSPPRRRRCWV